MTSPTFAEIRQALADTVENGCEMEIFSYAQVPDVNQCPALIVKPLKAKYLVNFGTDATYEFQLFVLVARQDGEVAQEQLDTLLNHFGTDSIPAIIRANPTLGLDSIDAQITEMNNYGGEFKNAQIPHIGAILKCTVEADP